MEPTLLLSWSKQVIMVVVDNLVNSNRKSLEVVERITGVEIPLWGRYPWYWYSEIFSSKKSQLVWFTLPVWRLLGESTRIPSALLWQQYQLELSAFLKAVEENNCKNIIFKFCDSLRRPSYSSNLRRFSALSVTNPYGRTKLMLEEIFDRYLQGRLRMWNVVLLRYF